MIAAANSVSVINPRPIGISTVPTVTFSGTFHSRGASRSLKRSTSIASDLNAKLQTTPNAYASPSTYTSPRLSTIVDKLQQDDEIDQPVRGPEPLVRHAGTTR